MNHNKILTLKPMALITGIRRFFIWYIFTLFRTVFKKKYGGWQIHFRGYIIDFHKNCDMIIAKKDGKTVKDAFMWHKTIYKGYRI